MINLYFILRMLVYAQSLLWIKLLDYKYKVKSIYLKKSFSISLGILYLWLLITDYQFSQYTNHLLRFYIFLLLYAFIILRMYKGFYDSICLTFIIVFINSYYWEFMLHFNAILFYGLSFNQFVQALHLIPSYLLYRKLEITNRPKFFKLICFGLLISNINLLALNFIPINKIYITNKFLGYILHSSFRNNIIRFLCLNILLCAITEYTKIIKKEERLFFLF